MSALGQKRTSLERLFSAQPFNNPAALNALLITAPMSGSGGIGSCCHIGSSSLSSTSPSDQAPTTERPVPPKHLRERVGPFSDAGLFQRSGDQNH
jgi:hypothetical protein